MASVNTTTAASSVIGTGLLFTPAFTVGAGVLLVAGISGIAT